MKNRKQIPTLLGVALGVAFCASVSAHASGIAFEQFQKLDQFDRLQRADSAVRADSKLKALLKEQINHIVPEQMVSSDEIETTKFQHYFKGLEVIGSMAFHHIGRAGEEITQDLAQFDLDITPTLSTEEVTHLAQGWVGDQVLGKLPQLRVLPSSANDGSARLIYHVLLTANEVEGGRELFIDAHTGEVIADMPRDLPLALVQVYSTTGKTLIQSFNPALIGKPRLALNNVDDETDLQDVFGAKRTIKKSVFFGGDLTPETACQVVDSTSGYPMNLSPENCTKVVSNSVVSTQADDAATRAFNNSQAALNYYMNTHKRNSFDGKGTNLVNIVHIGSKFSNAFWSQDLEIMAYGDGDGETFADFTRAVDVAGHELTHGVTSKTAKLIYQDESGALSEAFSDFFGKMIAHDGDWVVGQAIFKNPSAGKGIRDLANPGNLTVCLKRDPSTKKCTNERPYPSNVSERFPRPAGACGRDNDHCWVHINATIPGHGMYLVTVSIGKEKAERLFFAVLTQYLTASAKFQDFSKATQNACKQLYDGATCGKVTDAFTGIGL